MNKPTKTPLPLKGLMPPAFLQHRKQVQAEHAQLFPRSLHSYPYHGYECEKEITTPYKRSFGGKPYYRHHWIIWSLDGHQIITKPTLEKAHAYIDTIPQHTYREARALHAFLLKHQGCGYNEIATRLSTNTTTAIAYTLRGERTISNTTFLKRWKLLTKTPHGWITCTSRAQWAQLETANR
jgi:hypothetical protein